MNLKFLSALIVFITASSFITAQNLGGIQGKVIDNLTKQPLVGANILVLEIDGTPTDRGAVSDESGLYSINYIQENIYKIRISFIGYNSHIESDIRVIRGKIFSVREIEMTESPIVGKDVVVSSGYFDDDKNMSVSNYSFTREEIVRAPGAGGDIFRAIESLPGIASIGGEFSAFSVRGDTPQDNLILIDNIPFSNVSHFSETDGDLEIQGGRFSIFTQGLIDKAEFQAGGFSSMYGGKKASLLNLKIKEGNKISPILKGSYDLLGWELFYDGPSFIEPNSSLIFSARKIDFGTILKLVDDEGDGNSKFSDFILKTTTDINSANKITLLGIYSNDNHLRDSYHYLVGKDKDELELANEKEYKNLAGVNWRLITGNKGFLTTSIYYSRVNQSQTEGQILVDPIYDRKLNDNEINVRYPIYVYNINEKQYGVKTDFTYSVLENLTVNTGFSIQRMDVNTKAALSNVDTLFTFKSDEVINGNYFLVVSPEEFNCEFKKNRMEYAGYIETSFSPWNTFKINTGLRYEYDNWSKLSYFSPRINGTYKLNSLTSINFSTGIYHQLPRLRYISFNAGNQNLKSEKSYHFILGISRYISGDLKFNAEGYYKRLEDLILEINSGSNLAQNSGKGYSYGADISLIKKFVDKFYGQINYSYSQCKVKENNILPYHYSDFQQPHMFNILFGYQLDDNWSFSIKWKYAAGRPKDDFIIHANVLSNENEMRYSKEIISENTKRYSDFHSLNFRIDYRKQFTSFLALSVYIDIMNLYNRSNEVYEIYEPISGKNKFSSLGFVPTFGFKIEI